MSWFTLILISAFMLGSYDFCKKHAVRNNRVMPVLFLATLSGTLFLLTMRLCSGNFMENFCCPPSHWCAIFLKGVIVSASWVTGYFALHDLPISLVAPIRASSPVWVVLGSTLLFHEFPTPGQWAGVAIVFIGYYLFATIGKSEGFSIHCRGFKMIVGATLIGSVSALYDRFIIHYYKIPPDCVQLHFSIDLVIILGTFWWVAQHTKIVSDETPFVWRWSIIPIGILLIGADWSFFHALAVPEANTGILAVMRRLSVVISFIWGAIAFGEQHIKKKAMALLLLLAGVVVIGLTK